MSLTKSSEVYGISVIFPSPKNHICVTLAMPQYDYDSIDDISEDLYRPLDMEIKRPKKIYAVLWWVAGVLWALLVLIMIMVGYYRK
jgi:hypothetical protein